MFQIFIGNQLKQKWSFLTKTVLHKMIPYDGSDFDEA